jgi:UDP-2,4-diacetamido-2,4,6-trideoxy-beta-L-altropyranose hydrolase
VPADTKKTVVEISVILRLVESTDVTLVYHWQTAPDIRKYFRDPVAPALAEHQAWFKKALVDPLICLYIVCLGDEPVGLVRLDDLGKAQVFEISILIKPSAQGKGVGLAALKATELSIQPEIILRAGIRHGNEASARMFSKAGYVLDADDGIEMTYLLPPRLSGKTEGRDRRT